MSELHIPADMNLADKAQAMGAKAVVSIRDFMVLLGASDQELRDFDERNEILARDPWRKDGLWFEVVGTLPDGMKAGFQRGEIDWSGTRFDGIKPRVWKTKKDPDGGCDILYSEDS